MHLLIPFAFCHSEGCAAALKTLKLPHLEKLLARLTPAPLDPGDEFSLSPPHERALARALALPVADGLIPWAARQAQAPGAWAFITPCHWQVGARHIAMSGAELPDFSAAQSQALLTAMQPFFAEDGITLQFDRTSRWLACGAAFDGLASAALDRVAGRDIARWMPRGATAAKLQRLQSEMQMLLYTHPVNEARAARGLPAVNSFWFSGTGALPVAPRQPASGPEPLLATRLRAGALTQDWAAWAQAWQALDATECAALLAALEHDLKHGRPLPLPTEEGVASGASGITLTLCGERHAQSWSAPAQPYWKRWMTMFNRRPASELLETL